MTITDIMLLVLIFLGFAVLTELSKIRSAVEGTESIERKKMYG